jgi:hypothetical protein
MYKFTTSKNTNEQILQKSNIEKSISNKKVAKDYEAIRDIVMNKQESKKNDNKVNNNNISKFQNFFI